MDLCCFQSQEVLSADHWKLYTFEFNDFELTDDETILASIRIMLELDFLDAVHTKQEVNGNRVHEPRRKPVGILRSIILSFEST